MIPRDHITFDGDTAWLVVSDERGQEMVAFLWDRPCDKCDGTRLRHVSSPDGSEVYAGPGPCPDCIDGRHTFDIQVEAPDSRGPRLRHPSASSWRQCDDTRNHNVHQMLYDPWVACPGLRTYQVSIGMVLPIVEQHDGGECPDAAHICVFYGRMGGEEHQQWCYYDGDTTEEELTLPSAAKPGMFAVQLKVTS